MKFLGLTAQKPLYQTRPQDEKLVPQWKEDTYPEIKRGAKKAGATIYFTDESGISSDYHTGRPRQQREIGRKAVKFTGREEKSCSWWAAEMAENPKTDPILL